MTTYAVVKYSRSPGFYFEYTAAASLASVSTQFIRRCEDEDLIRCRMMIHGQKGLCFEDVQKLKLIRHLHEDMGLALDAVDFLLRYRNRLKMIERRMDEMKRHMREKERGHQAEIRALRRRLVQLSGKNEIE